MAQIQRARSPVGRVVKVIMPPVKSTYKSSRVVIKYFYLMKNSNKKCCREHSRNRKPRKKPESSSLHVVEEEYLICPSAPDVTNADIFNNIIVSSSCWNGVEEDCFSGIDPFGSFLSSNVADDVKMSSENISEPPSNWSRHYGFKWCPFGWIGELHFPTRDSRCDQVFPAARFICV